MLVGPAGQPAAGTPPGYDDDVQAMAEKVQGYTPNLLGKPKFENVVFAKGEPMKYEVDVEVRGRSVIVRRREGRCCRGEAVVRHLRGRGSVPMTTDQIMALTRGA